MNWLKAIIQGQQKAVYGGLAAGLATGALSLLALVGITGDMTVKEAVVALANWVVAQITAHTVVYKVTNK